MRALPTGKRLLLHNSTSSLPCVDKFSAVSWLPAARRKLTIMMLLTERYANDTFSEIFARLRYTHNTAPTTNGTYLQRAV